VSAGSDIARPLRAFVEELARAGLRDAVVCPGSRSTPLALALRAHPDVRVRVLLDERAAGYFGLGLARASRRPVALLATSGTAVVNFAPTVVEAFLGRVPLLVLTADRPPELRDRGAPQTIDQVGLYGAHVKWSVDLPVLDETPELLAHARSAAGRAMAVALAGPAGPVHLNLPFREPLIPDGSLGPEPDGPAVRMVLPADHHPYVAAVSGPRLLAPSDVEALAERLAATARGVVVAGPQDDPEFPAAVARLAAATGYPILADHVMLDAPIRTLDSRMVKLEFADEITAEVKVWVVREGGTPDGGDAGSADDDHPPDTDADDEDER